MPSSKRANTLAEALGQLGLGPGATTSDEAAARAVGVQAGVTGPRCRFRKLATLTATQLGALDERRLQELLAQWQNSRAVRQGGRGSRGNVAAPSGAPISAGLAAAAAAAVTRAQQGLQAGREARYEQVMRRRNGLTSFALTEAAPDPLPALAKVHDLVLREGGRGEGASQQREQQQQQSTQQPGGQQHQGVQKQRRQQERQERDDQGGEQLEAGGGGGGGGGGGEGAVETAGEGDYVYDLYAPAADDSDGSGGGEEGEGGKREAWLALHAGGRAPVVHIVDEASWLVLEASDQEDSCADSEDSNAEGYHAHDYPGGCVCVCVWRGGACGGGRPCVHAAGLRGGCRPCGYPFSMLGWISLAGLQWTDAGGRWAM